MLGFWIGITPVQANEFNINIQEETVCYGIIPNPFKVATKVITAPAKAAKKKLDTARKVVKMGKKASKIGESDDNDNKDGDIGDRADVVEKNKKKDDKQFQEWKKHRDQDLEAIAKEREEREKLKRELGMTPETSQKPQEKADKPSMTTENTSPNEDVKAPQNGGEKATEASENKVSQGRQWNGTVEEKQPAQEKTSSTEGTANEVPKPIVSEQQENRTEATKA